MKFFKYILLIIIFMFLISDLESSDKKWELELHYSTWSINFLSSPLIGILEDEIKDYDPEKGVITLDSSGYNIGIGVRYFPGGRNGSFSLGFSHERNVFKLDLTTRYVKADPNGNQMVVDGTGKAELYPHSFNFNIRWEIFPSYLIHPYIGFGIGVGVLVGNVEGYATSVTTFNNGETLTQVEYDEKDSLNDVINEYKEDGNSVPIGFFPFLQVQFGIRGEIFRDFNLLAEVQFYNGFSIRGGISYRF